MLQTIYILSLLLSVLISLWVSWTAWRNRNVTGARSLALLAIAAIFWTGGTLGAVFATAETGVSMWHRISYVGRVLAPVASAVFALQYTGYTRYATKYTVGSLLGLSAIFLGLAWTNPGSLYWTSREVVLSEPNQVVTTPGFGLIAFAVFSYLLLLIGSVVLVKHAVSAPELYRQQTIAILVGVFAPWIVNVPHILQLIQLDWTPFGITVAMSAYRWAMFRYRLTDIAPIAHRTVLANISPGVYVLDHEERLVDINSAGKELFGIDENDIGSHVTKILPNEVPFEQVREQITEKEKTNEEGTVLTLNEESDSQYYDVQVTRIETETGRHVGETLVVTDITEQYERQQRLIEQKEQLDEFASVISHDLRNPLNVASGRLELAREEVESSHLEIVGDSLNRMEALIDDVLTLAREGKQVQTTTAVELAKLTEQCWTGVATGSATLVVETDQTIHADESRLRQLFENLFRNAVEHGGEDVTITVGFLSNGFYVADDGTGIPADDRTRIFESGYSTTQDGTGLGLSIVEQIAIAHEWEIRATDSEMGGARFEITGVETS